MKSANEKTILSRKAKLLLVISNPKLSTLFFAVFLSSLLIDSLSSDISSIINSVVDESVRTSMYILVLSIALFSGAFTVVNTFVTISNKFKYNNNSLILIPKLIIVVQFLIIMLLTVLTLEIASTSQFLTMLLIYSLVLSWTTGVVLLGIMSFRFLQWYKANHNYLILLYLVSSAMFAGTLGATIIPQTIITVQSTSVYTDAVTEEVKPFQTNPQNLNILFGIISIANWLVIPLWYVIWGATVSILSNYSKLLGKIKFAFIVIVPLFCAIIGDISWLIFLPSLTSIFDEQVILFTMIAFGGLISGGFLLGYGFLIISRSIRKSHNDEKIVEYLSISAKGVAILFVSFFANPSVDSYLPYGVLAASFFAFGAFLYFYGIYASAISIATNQNMRRLIRTSLLDQSKLLDNIGKADINSGLEEKVKKLSAEYSDQLQRESGIESFTSNDDLDNYINEIISEIQKHNKNLKGDGKHD